MEWPDIFLFVCFHLFWMEEAIPVSQWYRLESVHHIETLAKMTNTIVGCCFTFKLFISMYQSLFFSGR